LQSRRNRYYYYKINIKVCPEYLDCLDCLNYVKMLKDLGIGVIFEKENINTLDSKGEVLLFILSSLAQDESCSISKNSTGI